LIKTSTHRGDDFFFGRGKKEEKQGWKVQVQRNGRLGQRHAVGGKLNHAFKKREKSQTGLLRKEGGKKLLKENRVYDPDLGTPRKKVLTKERNTLAKKKKKKPGKGARERPWATGGNTKGNSAIRGHEFRGGTTKRGGHQTPWGRYLKKPEKNRKRLPDWVKKGTFAGHVPTGGQVGKTVKRQKKKKVLVTGNFMSENRQRKKGKGGGKTQGKKSRTSS